VTTLRAKLALLLAVAIVSVVGILTGVLLYLLKPPGEHHTIGPVAEQVITLAGIAREEPQTVSISPAPAEGRIKADVTEWLRETLAAQGNPLDVIVSRERDGAPQVVSVPVDNGWLKVKIPDLPPRKGGWNVLLTWLALITFGAMAIAILVANRMVKPLVFLEKAIESVGPDALLPELPVKGPAEVRVAARALNSLSSRLKGAMESRMRLVAAAGHDLRTPITRMRLRAEFVPDNDDRAMWLKDIDELERIADSAILLVREESGKAAPETFRLDELISDLADELQGLSYDVTIVRSEPITVRANRMALSRAFRNLLINAATHGVRGRVRMNGTPAEVCVVIDDEGPGIPPDLIGQVFEPFFRVNPARQKTIEGAGLGLTIAHEIIQRAGGTIKIENGPEHGLRQTVKLRLSNAA
jgi:signal transduction histidine kinase